MKAIAVAKVRIGVAEVPGSSMKKRLQRSDPFRGKRCKGENYWVFVEGHGGRCRVDGIIYKVAYKGCETSKSAYTRGLEHRYDMTQPPSKTHPSQNTRCSSEQEEHSSPHLPFNR